MNEVNIGKRLTHKTRQKCPPREDVPVLITVETHSVIETGEVTYGTGSGMLSEVQLRALVCHVGFY